LRFNCFYLLYGKCVLVLLASVCLLTKAKSYTVLAESLLLRASTR
jgi:hypothetical protein